MSVCFSTAKRSLLLGKLYTDALECFCCLCFSFQGASVRILLLLLMICVYQGVEVVSVFVIKRTTIKITKPSHLLKLFVLQSDCFIVQIILSDCLGEGEMRKFSLNLLIDRFSKA